MEIDPSNLDFTVHPLCRYIFQNTISEEMELTFTLSVSNSTKGSSDKTLSPLFFNRFATVASVTDSLK